ncbi:MAG: aromatic amino acid lyase, partial [Candidatus Eremiobacteraeota bacterium]|nr:aromatic amino acid lyase [Candidatus Eremiobacteraeota bacterium]
MKNKNIVSIDGETLTIKDVCKVARESVGVKLSQKARKKMRRSLQLVNDWIRDEKVIYGISTGFGGLSEVLIPPGEIEQLQHNLIRSHCTGIGPLLDDDVVRAMM